MPTTETRLMLLSVAYKLAFAVSMPIKIDARLSYCKRQHAGSSLGDLTCLLNSVEKQAEV
jgi:PIN domain nuclease of toxin-antitoxin system